MTKLVEFLPKWQNFAKSGHTGCDDLRCMLAANVSNISMYVYSYE